jgi:hypothetical protein
MPRGVEFVTFSIVLQLSSSVIAKGRIEVGVATTSRLLAKNLPCSPDMQRWTLSDLRVDPLRRGGVSGGAKDSVLFCVA